MLSNVGANPMLQGTHAELLGVMLDASTNFRLRTGKGKILRKQTVSDLNTNKQINTNELNLVQYHST